MADWWMFLYGMQTMFFIILIYHSVKIFFDEYIEEKMRCVLSEKKNDE